MSSPQQHDEAPALANFLSLPYELRMGILELTDVSWNRKTAATFMLVSRDVYELVAIQRYRYVQIDRPSILEEFVRSIVANPALARLVKVLWLGPYYTVSDDWWPLAPINREHYDTYWYEGERPSIATALRDRDMLPHGCEPRQKWALTKVRTAKLSRRDKAIYKAIDAAQNYLRIDLRRPRRARDGGKMGSTLWLVRVMEVQAALDLYLVEIRRREDAAGVSSPLCPRPQQDETKPTQPEIEYPSLVITSSEPPTTASLSSTAKKPSTLDSSSVGPSFIIPRPQLMQHIFAKGSKADHFDHPLILARSGIKSILFKKRRRGYLCRDLERSAKALYGEAEEEADSGSLPDDASLDYVDSSEEEDVSSEEDEESSEEDEESSEESEESSDEEPSDEDEDLTDAESSEEEVDDAFDLSSSASPLVRDLMGPQGEIESSTTSIGGILNLAGTLLALTSNVETLFLTGYLQRTLCAEGAVTAPPSLRRLHLGPLSHRSDDSMSPSVEGGRLQNLEELGLRGCFLDAPKRECLRSLPRLKTAYWNLEHSKLEGGLVVNAFKSLLGRAYSEDANGHEVATPHKRSRASFENDGGSDQRPLADGSHDVPSPSPAADAEKPLVCITMNETCEAALRPRFLGVLPTAWRDCQPFDAGDLRIRLWTQHHPGFCDQVRDDVVSDEFVEGLCDTRFTWETLDDEE